MRRTIIKAVLIRIFTHSQYMLEFHRIMHNFSEFDICLVLVYQNLKSIFNCLYNCIKGSLKSCIK